MNKPVVYLAGPITGRSYTEASAWRCAMAERLEEKWEILDPLRGFTPTPGTEGNPLPHDFDGGRAAVRRDLSDIRRCDVVLAHLYGSVASLGTLCELGYAAGIKDCHGDSPISWPRILVVARNELYEHVFVRELADETFENLHLAANWLQRFEERW